MVDDAEEKLRLARVAVGSLSSGDVRGAEGLAAELSRLPMLLSFGQGDPSGTEWAISQLELLNEQYPESAAIATAYAQSLTMFSEHGQGRAAIERKLRRLRHLAEGYSANQQTAAIVASAYANVALSREARAQFPSLCAEAAQAVEAIAEQHPGDAHIATHLALVLQNRIESTSDLSERAAAVAGVETLAGRHPNNEHIATARNLVSGPQQRQGGCYVATAVYGSYDCPEVLVLRSFRDRWLERSSVGRLAIRGYYAISPSLVRHFGDRQWFGTLLRPCLDSIVARLRRVGF